MKMENAIESKRAKVKKGLYTSFQEIFISKGLLLYIIGLLLGRAVILYNISPFAIAFLATVWAVYQKRMLMIILFILIGAWTYSVEHAVFITLSIVLFVMMASFLKDRTNFKFLILFVFFSTVRSEEHTSELQSRGHLVCRLLLEKKNITNRI